MHKKYIKNNRTTTKILPDDVLMAHEYRKSDYQSSEYAKNFFNHFYKSKLSMRFGDIDLFENDIIKRLSYEFQKIIVSMMFFNKVKDDHNTIIWPEYCDTEVLNYYLKNCENSNTINISKVYYIINYFYTKIKNVFFTIKLILYLEKILLIFRSSDINESYKYTIHMDDGLVDWNIIDKYSIVDNFDIKKKDVLFVNNDSKKNTWQNQFKLDALNVLDLKSILKSLSMKEKLDIYRKNSGLRLNLLYLIFYSGFLSSFSYKHLSENIKWHTFHKKIQTNKVISFMIPRPLIEQKIHKMNNVETIFLYFSITEQLIEDISNSELTHCLGYSFMQYDTIISSNISNNWLKTLNNQVTKYIDCPPFMCERIYNYSDERSISLDCLNIANDKKLVCILDSPVGLYSVMNLQGYKDFINTITMLVENHKDIEFLFKTKKPYQEIKSLNDKEIISLVDNLISQKNVKYVNNLNISIYEAIGIANVVISAPKSSAIYESLFSKTPTIIFKPLSLTINTNNLYNQINRCEVTNYDDLVKLFNYFIESNEQVLEDGYLREIKDILGDSDGSSSISLVRNYLMN